MRGNGWLRFKERREARPEEEENSRGSFIFKYKEEEEGGVVRLKMRERPVVICPDLAISNFL